MPRYALEPRLSQIVAAQREGGELHLDVPAVLLPLAELLGRVHGKLGMIDFGGAKKMGKMVSPALSSPSTPSRTSWPRAAWAWCCCSSCSGRLGFFRARGSPASPAPPPPTRPLWLFRRGRLSMHFWSTRWRSLQSSSTVPRHAALPRCLGGWSSRTAASKMPVVTMRRILLWNQHGFRLVFPEPSATGLWCRHSVASPPIEWPHCSIFVCPGSVIQATQRVTPPVTPPAIVGSSCPTVRVSRTPSWKGAIWRRAAAWRSCAGFSRWSTPYPLARCRVSACSSLAPPRVAPSALRERDHVGRDRHADGGRQGGRGVCENDVLRESERQRSHCEGA